MSNFNKKNNYDPFSNTQSDFTFEDIDAYLNESKDTYFSPFGSKNIFAIKNNEGQKSKNTNIEVQNNYDPVKKRLNAYDVEILDNSMTYKVSDEDLNPRRKIEEIEFMLENVNEKLKIAQSSMNSELILKLQKNKIDLEKKLEYLNEQISQKSIVYKMTKNKLKSVNCIAKTLVTVKNTIEKIIFYIFPKTHVKDTLSKLNKINKNVDELVKLQVPYGEEEDRYRILASHLVKASTLHSKISKEIK